MAIKLSTGDISALYLGSTAVSAAYLGSTSVWSAGGGAFDPTSITGLQLWLDASDESTLYDATSGGSLVAADGTVARWEDRSGNGRHATSGTGPQRKTSRLNGRDALLFNGSNTFLEGTSTPGTGNTRTVFAVSTASANVSQPLQIGRGGSGGTPSVAWVNISADATKQYVAGDGYFNNLDIGANFLTHSGQFLVAFTQASTSSFQFHYNRTSYAVNGSLVNFNPVSAGYYVGKFRTASDVAFHPADIAEILIYDSALSDTDREAVEDYLIAKWGIT